MAKYTASPWGTIRGKLGSAVGGQWKGIKFIREHGYPRQLGTIRKYDINDGGCTRGVIFSAKQLNIRRAIFGMLGFQGRMTLNELIIPVWQTLCNKKGYKKTGINLFIQRNARLLWHSYAPSVVPSGANHPDYTKMVISDGDLEHAYAINSAVYNFPAVPPPPYPSVTVTWDPTTMRNGKSSDLAWVAVYKVPPPDEYTKLNPFGTLFVRNTGVTRAAGTATIPVYSSAAADLVAFVFFSDNCANYSPSISRQVT